MTKFTICLLLSIFSLSLFGQNTNFLEKAVQHLSEHHEDFSLTTNDLGDIILSSSYVSKHNGVTHTYLIQRYQGIEIHNAIANVHFTEDGKPFYAKSQFVGRIQDRIQSNSPSLHAKDAVKSAATTLGYPSFNPKQISHDRSNNAYIFEKGAIAISDIDAQLKYFLSDEGQLILVWDVLIDDRSGQDYANIRIDANSGELVDRTSLTVSCQFEPGMYHRHSDICYEDGKIAGSSPLAFGMQSSQLTSDGPNYNVFRFPAESPVHGELEFVSDDFYPSASPFGWHDANGEPGPEYTITRGNNVWAFPARDGNNFSNGGEPDGGEELVFDFPYNPELEPEDYLDFSTVSLFYSNNILHDFSYAYGFDEASGNFQANNYGNGGQQGDQVLALAQFGAEGGQSINNATFATPSDGGNGRMSMYVWNSRDQSLLEVLEPASISRRFATGSASDFGAPITETPVTGKIVPAFNAGGNPSLACSTIINPEEVEGNVAIVDRGSCFFYDKVHYAQEAGAIACIICNFENSVINMGGPPSSPFPNPTIPVVMLSSNDCSLLRQQLVIGEEVVVSFVNEETGGPAQLDGTLDNGIVAHEFGHGISNRLTGGPGASGCLSNNEQMGEGWSDFFTLVSTVKDGDTPTQPRGIGTFVLRQDNDGQGIRRFPYSTDMGINPITYDDIIGTTAPHPLGEVWVAILWDMYWAMVDKYGFDADINNQESGNSRALRLVMDGMRYQGCSPGFVDGRDGILIADEVLYNGANQCLIWEVFARRGLGFSSDQGSSDNRNDGREGYDVAPQCLNRLDVVKRSTPTIAAGDIVEVTLEVGNYSGDVATGVAVLDELPEGAAISELPDNIEVDQQGNALNFLIGDMNNGESITITYSYASPDDMRSTRVFYDDMEDEFNSLDLWDLIVVSGEEIWELSTEFPYEGERSHIIYTVNDLDMGLYNFEPIQLPSESPILRFYHNYDTEPGADGGIVEVSTDGGNSYVQVEDNMIRNGYRGKISYNAFTMPNIRAYWGPSNGWVETLVDLSDFAGQEVHVKFRYATDAENLGRPIAWSIDNIEILEPLFYNSEVCVTADNSEGYCNLALDGGTLVESGQSVSTASPEGTFEWQVFPNPADQNVNVSIRTSGEDEFNITVYSADGRIVKQVRNQRVFDSANLIVPTHDLAPGFYVFKIQSDREVMTSKVLVQH